METAAGATGSDLAQQGYNLMGSGRRLPPGWPQFRKMIFERDGWRCVNCGKPGKLECAHIVDVQVDPSRELDPSNARALCRECHLAETRQQRRKVSPEQQAWFELVYNDL